MKALVLGAALLCGAVTADAATITLEFLGVNGPVMGGFDPFGWAGASPLGSTFDVDDATPPVSCGAGCSTYGAMAGSLLVGAFGPFAVIAPSVSISLGGPEDLVTMTGLITNMGFLTSFGLTLALPMGTLPPSALLTFPTFPAVPVTPTSSFTYTVLTPPLTGMGGTFFPVTGVADAAVPEPATFALTGLSAIGIGLLGRIRRRRRTTVR